MIFTISGMIFWERLGRLRVRTEKLSKLEYLSVKVDSHCNAMVSYRTWLAE